MLYNWLLFDLDGTLLDFHKAEYLCMDMTLHAFEFRADEAVLAGYREINDAYWKMLELGEISQEELALARHRTLFERFDFTGDVVAFQKYYENALSNSSFLIPGAKELLVELKSQKDFHLSIVTNGFARIQNRRIELSGLTNYFEHIFISENVGFRKPQSEYFEQVFRVIGERSIDRISKDHTLIIGDSLTSDIKGGADFGIATCWYNPDRAKNSLGVRVDHEIRSLDEITRLLD